jgi:DNA repair protein RadC
MHNHPSGDPTPSQADIQMTRAIVDIANLLWSRADSIADIAVSTRTTPSEHSGLVPSLAERQ